MKRPSSARTLIRTAVIEAVETRQLFAGGAVDTTYASSGTASVNFKAGSSESTEVVKVVSDSGGRTYVIATTSAGSGTRTTLQIRRLTAAGTLDTTWAPNKSYDIVFSLTDAQQPLHGIAPYDALVDSSNKLVLLIGSSVYRFNANGVFDKTFGSKGIATAYGVTTATSLQADSSGHLYVFGTNVGTSTSTAVIDRLTAAGQADTSWSANGSEVITGQTGSSATSAYQYAAAMRVLSNDKVVLVTGSQYVDSSGTHIGSQMIRLTSSGGADSTYGSSGQIYVFGTDVSNTTNEYIPEAITGTGQVVLVQHLDNGTTETFSNVIVSADGSSYSTASLGKNSGDVLGASSSTDNTLQFITLADGTQVVVNNYSGSQLFKWTAAGSNGNVATSPADATFNNGNVLAGAQTAALQADGTLVAAANLSTGHVITVKRVYLDNAPVAVLSAKPLTTESTYKFSVVYRGPNGIADSTINGLELRVVGSNGKYVRPRLASKTTLSDGSIVATYRVTDLSGDFFSSSDNGTYAVRLLANTVQDSGGTYVPKRTLGNLTVAIA